MVRTAQRHGGREAEIAGVAAEALTEAGQSGQVLVMGDHDGAVAEALRGNGAEVTVWNRLALAGRTATAWPREGLFDAVVLRLPRGRAAFAMDLNAAAGRVPPNAAIWLYGGNDEGIVSAPRHGAEILDAVDTVAVKRRARVLCARRTAAPVRGWLEQWRETVALEFPGAGGPAALVSYPGLFAHGRLDPGTACLLEALPPLPGDARVLDFGCGGGALARGVRVKVPGCRLTLLDVDALALHAARQNVPDAECVLSDGWAGLNAAERFNLIVSNPPLHRGNAEDFGILDGLIKGAGARLTPKGALVLVAQRTAGVGKLMKAAFNDATQLVETPQYQVWRGAGGEKAS